MNERERFALKLREYLMAQGYQPKASVLERELNLRHYGKPISLHAVARWLRGEALPSFARLRTLANWLEVELTELVSVETADKLKRVEKQKEPSKYIWETAASYQDQLLFETFLKLPSEQRKIVREIIIAMHKAYGQQK